LPKNQAYKMVLDSNNEGWKMLFNNIQFRN
jgi:hypothetical protein